ncbi:excinuclease ABC subunit UvrB [Synechococcus sp. B60.1]|uniref:excinuclease ABC subunit UvrB n=1 Tax=Synechococcus sp. B60.1 TaxID=2964522 RepID=UPI0039C23B9D
MSEFQLVSPYQPTGDQPKAIAALVESIAAGHRFQTLLGATGTGKTFTIAHTIQQVGRPTLVMAPNKTLAAQLCNELQELFPYNAVEYFISYYDYYQPEAYVPSTDTYIAKSSSINDEIDMLRHSATRSLFERRDVIVVASVSCIYGLGMPEEYLKASIPFQVGQQINQREVLRDLANIQYERNDLELGRGRFRVKGDVLEIVPAYEDRVIRIEFFGDEIEAIRLIDPVTGEILNSVSALRVYPARHFVTPEAQLQQAILNIEQELEEQLAFFRRQGKLLEAQRLEQRTRYDLEMLREVGYCNGIENYSRHLTGRKEGEPPACLVDYFKANDWLLVVDESHVTVPQIRGMYNGDRARKQVLVDHGFRLPSALDNRPLKAEEFWAKVHQCVFVSATPGNWELEQSGAQLETVVENGKPLKFYVPGTGRVIEQVIRPTGVVDPEVHVRPTAGQVEDLLGEIYLRLERSQQGPAERVIVTTLTKRMAEDLTEYLQERSIRVRYLHSEIAPIERIEILQDFREGAFDVLVGVNLLREGLDLPEVSLVAILDADKEGFLRAERSLIQMIGRAARNVRGTVVMYADTLTGSMARAIAETQRRREIQLQYNRQHNITPKPIVKKNSNAILSFLAISRKLSDQDLEKAFQATDEIPLSEIPELIGQLELKMKAAAKNLEFEEAAQLRDQIKKLRQRLLGHHQST